MILRPFITCLRFFSGARPVLLANESGSVSVTLFLPNQLTPMHPGQDHWVQLSPFGDFGNVHGAARVIQRFRREDARRICDEFNGAPRRILQPLGMPFYIGHPDHPRFKGQPGHEDTRAYGRGKEMQVRHDPDCAACSAFANSKTAGDSAYLPPCQEHGLFVRMHWNDEGAKLIANESFHGHSVNWAAVAEGMENGVQVFRPVRVKSAGFTNEPNIPVRPASLANAGGRDTSDGLAQPAQFTVPPKLKLLAGFKEEDEVTLEEVIAALEKAMPVSKANEAANAGLEQQLVNIRALAEAERRGRATLLVDSLVKTGRVVSKDRAACVEQLCNAGDNFDRKAAELGNARAVIKTEPKSRDLAGRHAKVIEGERERTARLQELLDARQKEFPNESYEERFRAVAGSGEGTQLFAQMRRAGAEE
jgi:hypothetical protein